MALLKLKATAELALRRHSSWGLRSTTRLCNPHANEALALLKLKATVELAMCRQSYWGLRSLTRLCSSRANDALAARALL